MRKRVCVITATRAEYGLLKGVISEIESNQSLELCLVVTGTHLSHEHGYTVSEIENDGFPIAKKMPILVEGDNAIAITGTMANAMREFGKVFTELKPDMIVVLGDRYELIPICSAALVTRIPIAHISGGEITEGAIDDCIRHSITKMSNLHFPGCEAYRKRIIQLGEQPDTVFNYGDVGVENVLNTEYYTIEELENDLQIKLDNYICMTYHPVTTQANEVIRQVDEVLAAISSFEDMTFIISKSNADEGGAYINKRIEDYAVTRSNCYVYPSLGIRCYLSLLRYTRAVIGNSSSGIVEAPALKIPTVNIGDRQKGRLMATSIINCDTTKESIIKAIKYAISDEGINLARHTVSLYGSGKTSECIVEEIEKYVFTHEEYQAKKFYDIEFEEREI